MPTCKRTRKNMAAPFCKVSKADPGLTPHKQLHPAAQWACEQSFDPSEVDCTTAVVLKILDGKCKMLPGEMDAVMAIYEVVRAAPGELFDSEVHQCIDQSRQQPTAEGLSRIHQLRLHAEARIPKSVMKQYKARLRDGLFG